MGSSFCNRVNDDIFWFAEVGDELAVIGENHIPAMRRYR